MLPAEIDGRRVLAFAELKPDERASWVGGDIFERSDVQPDVNVIELVRHGLENGNVSDVYRDLSERGLGELAERPVPASVAILADEEGVLLVELDEAGEVVEEWWHETIDEARDIAGSWAKTDLGWESR